MSSAAPEPKTAEVDHLVVLARDLEQGAAWCQRTLGVGPQAGGKHALMGTQNLLLNISSARFPATYLELIAIDPVAANTRTAGAKRWFDMDCEALQASVATQGPRLIHFVARVPRIDTAVEALAALGIDRGAVLDASRATAAGLLRWRISVRDDGQRLFDGALPTLIEWDAADSSAHPTAALADQGVALQRLQVRHPQADALGAAYRAIGLGAGSVSIDAANAPRLCVRLDTPVGAVELCGP